MYRKKAIKSVVCIILNIFILSVPLFAQSSRIGKGDAIDIRVYNRPELSKTVTVREDGTIDYPFIANIPIDALSLDEFRNLLITQMSRYMGETPIVTVQLSNQVNIHVIVLGQVKNPGGYMIAKNGTLQGALAEAGGFTPQAKLDQVRIIRGKDATKAFFVDMYAFLQKGDLSMLPTLEDGDIIFVPAVTGAGGIKVIGEVKEPGNVEAPPGSSLLDVIYLAGGPTADANLKRIRLYSPARRVRDRVIDIDEIIQKSLFDRIPVIQNGDIIIMEKKHNSGRAFLEVMRNITSVAAPVIMILYYLGAIDRR